MRLKRIILIVLLVFLIIIIYLYRYSFADIYEKSIKKTVDTYIYPVSEVPKKSSGSQDSSGVPDAGQPPADSPDLTGSSASFNYTYSSDPSDSSGISDQAGISTSVTTVPTTTTTSSTTVTNTETTVNVNSYAGATNTTNTTNTTSAGSVTNNFADFYSDFFSWINSSDITIESETDFSEDVEFQKDISVGGTISIDGDVNIGGDLSVDGESSFGDDVTFENDVTIDGDLEIGGIDLSDNTSLLSGASLIGLFDNGYTNISGNTTVQGAIAQLDSALTTATHAEVTLAGTLDYLTLSGQEITLNQIDITTDVSGVSVSVAELNFLDGSTVANGGLVFGNGTNFTQDATNLFWDDGNNMLGLGTTAPESMLTVAGGATIGTGNTGVGISAPLNGLLVEGNVGIGTTDPWSKLDIQSSGSDFRISPPLFSGSSNDYAYFEIADTFGGGNARVTLTTADDNYGASSYLWLDPYNVTKIGFDDNGATSNMDLGPSSIISFVGGSQKLYVDANGLQLGLGGSTTGTAALPFLSFANDTNTGIFRQAADTFGISTAGLARVQVSPTGLVGIGTTAPGQMLDVSGGNIRTTGQLMSTVATGTAPLAVSSTTVVTNLNADLLDGSHRDTAYNSFGNGTIPLRNATGQLYTNYLNTTADVTATAATHFAIQTGSDNFIRWQTPADARTSLGLGSMATQNANAVAITGGSITGITDLAVADGGTGASDAATARTNLGLTAGSAGDIWVEKAGDTMTGVLTMSEFIASDVINFSAASTDDLRGIAFNGRTALSADSSDGYLRLNMDEEFTNGIIAHVGLSVTGTTAGPGISVSNLFGGGYAISATGGSTSAGYFYSPSADPVVVFEDGTTNCSVAPSAGGFTCPSDISLKKDITTIKNSLDTVMALRGVNFRWKTEQSESQLNVGFIAQEVQAIMPELVYPNSQTGLLSMNYGNLTPLLVNAIQEQQAQIGSLNDSISASARLGELLVNGKLTSIEAEQDMQEKSLKGIFSMVSQAGSSERYSTSDTSIEPGDVVVLDKPITVAKSNGENKDNVLGVVSGKANIESDENTVGREFCELVGENEEKARKNLVAKEIKSIAGKTIDAEIADAMDSGIDILSERENMITDLLEALMNDYENNEAVLDLSIFSGIEDSIAACKSTKHVEVALAGKVPVKYDLSNGEINAGDLLAVSDAESGKVMKATETGWIVGRALEDAASEDRGMIMMSVNLTWYTGETETLALDTSTPVDIEALKTGLEQILEIRDTEDGKKQAIFFSDMNVTGEVTADSLNTLGQITAGFLTIDSDDNSINVLGGGDLKLQNGINSGNIDTFNGALVLTSDGGIIAKAEIAADTIIARKVAVLGETTVTEQATSADGSTIGEETLGAGLLEVTIDNANVNPDSKIFITPTTSTGGKALIVKQKDNGSFTVSIDSAHSEDIGFDYWIVEVR